MATKTDIRDRAGSDLGLLRLGQSLQSQDATRITSAIDEVYADLKEEGLAIWASTAAYPDKVVPHVIALVCYNCTETYPVSQDRLQRILLKAGPNGETAKREIRRLTKPEYMSLEDPDNF